MQTTIPLIFFYLKRPFLAGEIISAKLPVLNWMLKNWSFSWHFLFWEVNIQERRVRSKDWSVSELDRIGHNNRKEPMELQQTQKHNLKIFPQPCFNQSSFTFIITTYFKFASMSVLLVLWFIEEKANKEYDLALLYLLALSLFTKHQILELFELKH